MPNRVKKLLIVAGLMLAVFGVGQMALAATDVWGGSQPGGGASNFTAASTLGNANLRIAIANGIRIFIGFLGIVAVVLIIYSGWLWMTAAGNPQKIEKAKKILTGALIGLVLILFSFAIASFILEQISGAAGPNIPCVPGDPGCTAQPPCVPGDPGCPLPAYNFIISATSPTDGQTQVYRNERFWVFFNDRLANAVDQNVMNNNFLVEKIADVNPGTGALTPVAPQAINGNRLFNQGDTLVSFQPIDPCGDERNTPNCFSAWSRFRVTINGNNGLISVYAGDNALKCNISPCVFEFSTNNLIDTGGPTAGIVPRQMCQDNNNALPLEANTVSGWGSDDVRVSQLVFSHRLVPAGPWIPEGFPQAGNGTGYMTAVQKYDTSINAGMTEGQTYTFRVMAFDTTGRFDDATFDAVLRPEHCCNGVKDGNEIGPDCGGDCGACAGSACAPDMNVPNQANNCQQNNFVCASQYCTSIDSNPPGQPDLCEAAGYPDGTNTCCLCQLQPIITGISPVGGFCNNNFDQACLDDIDCQPSSCNTITPNGAVGNLVTISGENFGNNPGQVYFFNNSPANLSACANAWQDNQIVVQVPFGAITGPVTVVTATGFSDDSLANPALPPFRVNMIARPGLCSLAPDHGMYNAAIRYAGEQLDRPNAANNLAYYGTWQASGRVQARTWTAITTDNQLTAYAPNIQTGRTTTFVANLPAKVFSNYLWFTKDSEAAVGPMISGFDPIQGSPGQYVTITGQGFGATKGLSEVYITGGLADHNFPQICQTSVWSNNQVIVKVPNLGANVMSGIIRMVIEKPGGGFYPSISTNNLNPRFFLYDSTLPLSPSLCHIDPTMGQPRATINLWGEYFDDYSFNDSKVRFHLSNYQSGFDIGLQNWRLDDTVTVGLKPWKVTTTVHPNAATGPVRVVKKVNNVELEGNSLNFTVGSCQNDSECENGNFCCPGDTPFRGQCRLNNLDPTLQGSCYPEYSSAVYQWNFTSENNNVIRCDNDLANPQCNPDGSMCPNNVPYCDPDSCICGQEPPEPSSCGGYTAAQCQEDYFCPNSPGQCSAYDPPPGTMVRTASCYCGIGNHYVAGVNNSYNKCVSDTPCDFPQEFSYSLGESDFTSTKTCKKVDDPTDNSANLVNRWVAAINTSCPVNWTRLYSGECMERGSACGSCSGDFVCETNPENNQNVCVIDRQVCPAGSTCDINMFTCFGPPEPRCECCCRKGLPGAGDCCFGLECRGACGAETTWNNPNFGRCTGCRRFDWNQEESNKACNCYGTTGKYCNTNAGESEGENNAGVCEDCSALNGNAWACATGGAGVCCADRMNGGGQLPCRGLEGQVADANGYCTYFACDPSGACVATSTSIYSTFRTMAECTDQCTPAPLFGQTCLAQATSTETAFNDRCDSTVCRNSGFHCLTADGAALDPDALLCGDCCCDSDRTCRGPLYTGPDPVPPGQCRYNNPDPSLAIDRCYARNPKLQCIADKGRCYNEPNTAGHRGLCCGCEQDSDCGANTATVGCGTDTCCQSRPDVLSTWPADGAVNICRNTVIKATFDQRMSESTLNDNFIVLGNFGTAVCPAGTEYYSLDRRPNIFARIKSTLAGWPLLNKLITKDAFAAVGNFCRIKGRISSYSTGSNTTVEFKPEKVLAENTQYYVLIKGDPNQTDGIREGILSESGIGILNTNSESFNTINYIGFIWSFITKGGNSSICLLDTVVVEPASYLYKSSINNVADDNAGPNYDTINDSDKLFRATAYSPDRQPLAPVANIYTWYWRWRVEDETVVKIRAGESYADNVDRHTFVAQNVKDASTRIIARAYINMDTLAGTTGLVKEGLAQAYVFLCNNPWPAPVAGSWAPWRDQGANCDINQPGCRDTGLELYYCRDAGGEGTADDLPAISNDALIHGSTVNILKEFYFFQENQPNIANINLRTVTNPMINQGGKTGLIWNAIAGARNYTVYWGTASTSLTRSLATTTPGTQAVPQIIDGLTNGLTYFFTVTATLPTGAESVFSNMVTYTPADTQAPSSPWAPEFDLSNRRVTPRGGVMLSQIASGTVEIGWWASTSTDTTGYKIYYGPSSGSWGMMTEVKSSQCSSTYCATSVTGLRNDVNYHFMITALDTAGLESPKTLNNQATLLKCSMPQGNCIGVASAGLVCNGGAGTCQWPNSRDMSCRSDYIEILKAMGYKRDQFNTYLMSITGTQCSECSCGNYTKYCDDDNDTGVCNNLSEGDTCSDGSGVCKFLVLLCVGGNPNASCAGRLENQTCSDGSGVCVNRTALCLSRLTETFNRLGFRKLPYGAYGFPYQMDENQGEFIPDIAPDYLSAVGCDLSAITVPLYIIKN